jgi:hypothetical protein
MEKQSMEFDHVGYRSYEKREGEFYYEPNKVWITDSSLHPFRIEWLRYEEDSVVQEPVKSQPHIGFRVKSIDASAKGMKLLLGPMIIDEKTTVAFYQSNDGGVIEFIEISE